MTLLLTDTERAELRDALARAEHLALEHARILAGCLAAINAAATARNDVPPEYVLPDGTVAHTLEEARWVMKGDWVQAVHGDTDWREVLHAPVHTTEMTALVTRRDDGSERIRWWGNEEKVRVATAPVPVVDRQERRWDR